MMQSLCNGSPKPVTLTATQYTKQCNKQPMSRSIEATVTLNRRDVVNVHQVRSGKLASTSIHAYHWQESKLVMQFVWSGSGAVSQDISRMLFECPALRIKNL